MGPQIMGEVRETVSVEACHYDGAAASPPIRQSLGCKSPIPFAQKDVWIIGQAS